MSSRLLLKYCPQSVQPQTRGRCARLHGRPLGGSRLGLPCGTSATQYTFLSPPTTATFTIRRKSTPQTTSVILTKQTRSIAGQHQLQSRSVSGLTIPMRVRSALSSPTPISHVHNRFYSKLSKEPPGIIPNAGGILPGTRLPSRPALPSSSSTLSSVSYSLSTASVSSSTPAPTSVFSSPPKQPSPSAVESLWQIPAIKSIGGHRSRPVQYGPLPLPIALKTFTPNVSTPRVSGLVSKSATAKVQLTLPPPPAVIGSQPLYHLAKRFPMLAEKELNALKHKSALDYTSFLIGAMDTSYPSATTLRAVVRQFRRFLKASCKDRDLGQNELPRARVWAQTIRGLIWMKQYRRARVAIHTMQRLGIKPTGYAWRSICRGWIESGKLDRAEALAAKVFLNPSLSHDHRFEEKPYYFSEMHSTSRKRHRSPMAPSSAPLFLVIEALAQQGEMERARHWFDQIPENQLTDMLTSDMVAGYIKVGEKDKAQEVIRIMARCGVKPTAIVFNPILEHAVNNMDMGTAEDLVKDMTQLGIRLNLFTYKILIQGYLSAGQKSEAMDCVKRIFESGIEMDRALGRMLLDGLWRLSELRRADQKPAPVSSGEQVRMDVTLSLQPGWSTQCREWIRAGKKENAEEVLEHVFQNSPACRKLDSEVIRVIHELLENQDLTSARRWYDRALHANHLPGSNMDSSELLELSNRMVAAYIRAQQPDEAEAVLGTMAQKGVQPTVDTINTILDWSTLQADMKDAEGLVSQMTQSGLHPNRTTFEILGRGYAAHGSLKSFADCVVSMERTGYSQAEAPLIRELCRVLLGQGDSAEVRQGNLSTASPRVLHSICERWVEFGNMGRAEEFVNFLRTNSDVESSLIPYGVVIQGWIAQSQQHPVSSGSIEAADQAAASKSDPQPLPPSVSVPASASLEREMKWRHDSLAYMRKARSWFDKVPEKELSVELVNQMIGGYVALGLEDEFEALIQWMATKKIKPNAETYNHILEYTVQKQPMSTAEDLVHKMSAKAGIAPNVHTWNLLIRGYVVRGQLLPALHCLDRMMGREQLSGIPGPKGKAKSKTREIIGDYDRDILNAVVHEDTSAVNDRKSSIVEPNETTSLLILSGFGPDLEPIQGCGDSARALEMYKRRVERQNQQKHGLLQGTLKPAKYDPDGRHDRIKDQMPLWEELGGSGSALGMTDLDWKNELQWEELMEAEKERERELAGPRRRHWP